MATFLTHIDYMSVKNLRDGNVKAFDDLFNKYSPKLYNFSLKYLKSAEEAEEIVQEVFYYIWEKREGLKPDQSFNSYIFTIAYNIIRKYFNKKAKENAYKDEAIYSLLKDENSLDRIIDYKSLLGKVESVIDRMPDKRREVFIKRKYEELPVKQIAKDLGISPNTVENHLASAQKYLLEEMKKEKLAGMLFFVLFLTSWHSIFLKIE